MSDGRKLFGTFAGVVLASLAFAMLSIRIASCFIKIEGSDFFNVFFDASLLMLSVFTLLSHNKTSEEKEEKIEVVSKTLINKIKSLIRAEVIQSRIDILLDRDDNLTMTMKDGFELKNKIPIEIESNTDKIRKLVKQLEIERSNSECCCVDIDSDSTNQE